MKSEMAYVFLLIKQVKTVKNLIQTIYF